jgi:hypothetical protein
MEMVKGILALALLGVLTAGDALATSGPTSLNAPFSPAGHVAPSFTVEQPVAPLQEQPAPTTVEGHATSLGSSAPQPLGAQASTKPAARIPAPAPHPTCPAGLHMGIMCTLH